MQLDAQVFLNLVEKSNRIGFFDTEGANLDGDYGTLYTASVVPMHGSVKTFCVSKPGQDKKLVEEFSSYMTDNFDLWVSYYGKLHDVPLLNTRLLKHGLSPLPKKHHLDLYWTVRQLATSRRSQAHINRWLGLKEQKMGVSPDVWAQVGGRAELLEVLKKRCESDTKGLREMYRALKLFVKEIQR